MKRLLTCSMILLCGLPLSCQAVTTGEPIPACEWGFTETVHEEIKVVSVTAPKSTLVGSAEDFANVCKPTDSHELLFKNSLVKTHQAVFTFDSIYPLEDVVIAGYVGDRAKTVETVSVDVSLDGVDFDRVAVAVALENGSGTIDLSGRSAIAVRLVFPAAIGETHALQDVAFHLGEGFIVREAIDWSDAFLRYSGWTGADGIFSFNLKGDDAIGATDPITAFVFSDTFVGTVDANTLFRKNSVMINNSVGYFTGGENIADALSFGYRTGAGAAQSAFLPDAYVGFTARNLLDSDGLSSYFDADATLGNEANGTMWRTARTAADHVDIDFGASVELGRLVVWNYNENPDYGASRIRVLTSDDGDAWSTKGDFDLPKASGQDGQAAAASIPLSGSARYVRILILDGYDATTVGLGKLLFEDADGEPLFGSATASSTDPAVLANELSARLWLQDGIVLGESLYLFPLLVKDDGSLFKVTRVGMIKAPIVDDEIDFEHAEYLPSPLQSRTPEGGLLYYGAGVMDHSSVDGYVYVYGYLDLDGRHLTVARVLPEDIEDWTAWRYYDGTGWSKDPNDSAPLLEGVSPELSVTRIESGLFAGKYLLVAMEGTTSGNVAYSVGDTPTGPFSDFTTLYQTKESTYLRGAFTYNAKMHAHLSTPGRYLVSYNVNTTMLSALNDARIYHPRFLWIIETKRPA